MDALHRTGPGVDPPVREPRDHAGPGRHSSWPPTRSAWACPSCWHRPRSMPSSPASTRVRRWIVPARACGRCRARARGAGDGHGGLRQPVGVPRRPGTARQSGDAMRSSLYAMPMWSSRPGRVRRSLAGADAAAPSHAEGPAPSGSAGRKSRHQPQRSRGSRPRRSRARHRASRLRPRRRDAPVRMVEMSDYGCGYCRKFHVETWPVLKRNSWTPAKVEWKFLPFVTGMFKNSPQATRAAECALEQGGASSRP